MENLAIYNASRTVPKEAQKPISAGRLKGKTDINPMWRIKKLTEMFGAVGVGWYYEIDNKWLDIGADGEVCANVEISLYIKNAGEWSKPIKGLGGSQFVAKESKGYYTDDDCYKKALTDAISVSCKALGIGADIYWDKDPSKYDRASGSCETGAANATQGANAQPQGQAQAGQGKNASPIVNKAQIEQLLSTATSKQVYVVQIEKKYNKKIENFTIQEWSEVMNTLAKM